MPKSRLNEVAQRFAHPLPDAVLKYSGLERARKEFEANIAALEEQYHKDLHDLQAAYHAKIAEIVRQ